MENKSKNNFFSKKNIIIFLIVLVAIFASVLALLLTKNSKENLLLKCTIESVSQHYNTSRVVTITSRNKSMFYLDEIVFTKLSDNEEANNLLDNFVLITAYDKNNEGIVSTSKSGNQLIVDINIDLSNEQQEIIRKYIGTYDTSVSNLKKHFEEGGLVCEEF